MRNFWEEVLMLVLQLKEENGKKEWNSKILVLKNEYSSWARVIADASFGLRY